MSIEHLALSIFVIAVLAVVAALNIKRLLTSSPTERFENIALVADEGGGSGMVAEGLANEVSAEEEWIQLSPFGEFPHTRGLQRVDREAAVKMENAFRGFLNKLKRRFRGVPIYVGHPDVPGLANEYTDDKAYGWIVDLAVREDGFYGKPEWSAAGREIIKNKHYRFPSAYWDAEEVGTAKGKAIYQPHTLLSVGLTNKPRIPVQALANSEQQQGAEMNMALVAALLGLASTATEAEVTNKITELRGGAGKLTALENAESTARTALETITTEKKAVETKLANAETRLANIATERNRLALENALSAGRLTPAEKAEWEGKLQADYETNAPLLAKKAKAMKTTSALENAGGRRESLANAQEQAAAKFRGEVSKFKAGGMNAHEAWMAAKAAHPELHGAMSEAEGEV